MEPLPARLLCERQLTASGVAGVGVNWSNLIGPIVIPTALYRLNDNNEGAFEVFENPPEDITGAIEHREYVKLQSWFLAIVRELAKKPVPPKEEKGKKGQAPPQVENEDDAMLEDAAEEAAMPQAPTAEDPMIAPLKNVYLVPVCTASSDVDALLFTNASDPSVVDYTGVVAFAWYIETIGDADKALLAAIDAMLESNKFRINGAPRGSQAGGPPAGQGGMKYRSDLRKSVEAMNGPTPHHDLQQCMFSLNYKATEDWSVTFRSAADMAYMFSTLLGGWKYDLDDVRSSHIVTLMTGMVGGENDLNNASPEFYRLPSTALLPLRDGDDGVLLGAAGCGLLAFSIRAGDLNFSKVAKLTRFPLLREYSADRILAARERVRFKFIKTDPPMLNPQNKEGVIRRLRTHTAEQLQTACWDTTLLADAGTLIAEQDEDLPLLQPPAIPAGDREEREDDEGEGIVGWWRMRRPGDWDLVQPYDVYKGPGSKNPDPGTTLIRLTGCLTLGYADVVAGAHLRVEEYGRITKKKLAVSADGFVALQSESLYDPRTSSMVCKRRTSTVFASTGCNSPPVWPAPGDWERLPPDEEPPVSRRHVQRRQAGGSGVIKWAPKRRLWWRSDDGKMHVIIEIKVTSRPNTGGGANELAEQYHADTDGSSAAEPSVVMFSREVRPERWIAIPSIRHEQRVVVPTVYESRSRMMRRLETDAEEALRQENLLSDSYVRSFKWFRASTERFRNTSRPAGFDFVFGNLNGHMNYYASFLLYMEYAFNVRYYHPQIYRCYLGFRHTSKTWEDNVKMLHHILFGPPGAGKSFAMDLCKRMTPPGFSLPLAHESAQNKFVKLANVDQLTSIVVIHDEANAAQLGMQEAVDGRNSRAQNSLSQQAVEYKEMLTSRRNTSCVLETSKEHGRTREMFEVSTDMVQFQLMNNFPSLSPPMLSRFMSCCFYKFPRMDAAECKQRAANASRERLGDSFAELQQVLYVLQAKLDTLQAVGICAPVPEEGWKVLASEFERVLNERFPFAISESLTLDRKLQDAFQYVRMMANAYAVYVTFGHPSAPFYNLGNVTLEAFRTAERYIVPSDEMMYLALSMLESDIFPNGEVSVLSCISEMAETKIKAAGSVITVNIGDRDHVLTREVSISNLCADLRNYNEAMTDDADGQAAPLHAFLEVNTPGIPLWRTLLAQKERVAEVRGSQAKRTEFFAGSGLPAVDRAETPTLIPKLQYISVFESVATSEEHFFTLATNEIYKMMQGKENAAMPSDHVSKALFQLKCRSMKDSEALRDAEYARPMLDVVSVEEVGDGVGNRKRYRLLVAKVALDELRSGGLSIKAVFFRMLHRYSKPGRYLLNAPYECGKGKKMQYLPQLANSMTIRYHLPGCPARLGLGESESEAKDKFDTFAEANKADKFNADHSWPWASDEFTRGCECYRSRRLKLATGCAMPEEVRKNFVAMLGGSEAAIVQNGLNDSSSGDLSCTLEHLGWIAHVTRLTGRSPDDMTDADLEKAHLQHAHPTSTHWIKSGPSENYPYGEVAAYLKRMSLRTATTTTAQRQAMYPTDDLPDELDHPVFRSVMRS